jgi:hypothetical protein
MWNDRNKTQRQRNLKSVNKDKNCRVRHKGFEAAVEKLSLKIFHLLMPHSFAVVRNFTSLAELNTNTSQDSAPGTRV